jgi:hypothetical protein
VSWPAQHHQSDARAARARVLMCTSDYVRGGKAIATSISTPVLGESVASLGLRTPLKGVEPGELRVVLASKAVDGGGAETGGGESKSF